MAADAPRFFNVWIVKPNTVYRGVPFTVVADWIQEGRLLGSDCVRTPGAPAWEHLDAHPLFAPYFSGDGIARAEDVGEALDPIEMEFDYKKPEEDHDEDVDMIPLIDISMVLLVFFMMTAQNLMTSAPFQIPAVEIADMIDSNGNIIVSVRRDPNDNNRLAYYFLKNYEQQYTEQEVVNMVKEAKVTRGDDTVVIIQAEMNLEFQKVQTLLLGLENLGIKGGNLKLKVAPKPNAG